MRILQKEINNIIQDMNEYLIDLLQNSADEKGDVNVNIVAQKLRSCEYREPLEKIIKNIVSPPTNFELYLSLESPCDINCVDMDDSESHFDLGWNALCDSDKKAYLDNEIELYWKTK